MALSLKNGYVVYTRGATSEQEYWRRKHYQAISGADSIQGFYTQETVAKYKTAGAALISLAGSEREKELELIRSAGFDVDDAGDVKTFVENFNKVLMGKEQFKNAKTRLKAALQKEKQDKQYRAPTIASFFTSYLGTELNKNINAFIGSNSASLVSQDFSAWDAQFDQIINKSIKQAFKNMLTKVESVEGKELYGDSSQWKEVYEASRQIANFDDYFIEMIRSKIDFSRIQNILSNKSVKLQNKTRRGVRKVIDSEEGLGLRSEKKSRSIGGSVEEYVMSILSTLGSALSTSSSTGTRVFTSEKLKTDNVTIYSYEASIDYGQMAQNLTDLLNDKLQESSSLNHAAEIMESFYEENLSKLDKTFIVYGSTKSYTMSESFKGGFSAGTTRKLADAQEILSKAGIGNSTAVESYLNVAYNTGSGAYFSGRRAEVEENFKTALMSAAAHLLFDDWVSIGNTSTGGAKAIHVLQLEGLNLPLSVFLEATGKAMTESIDDVERMVKVSIKLPGATLHGESPMSASTKEEVLAEWEHQAAQAKSESTFSMHFLSNFKTIISQWISF